MLLSLPLLTALVLAPTPLPPGPGPLDNPLKGYAPYARAEDTASLPNSMAFVEVSWRELEPKEGEYRFEEWERKEWETPLAKDRHIVWRVWVDYPSQEIGVPQYLVDAGVKMNPYEQFGGGKSPDYEDPRFQTALLRLIDKLGERYGRNPRVAFVQIGLLGHWGEFHTYPRAELFASEATQKRIVSALKRAMPNKMLMGRNPTYPSLQTPWMGFHDDMIPEDTLDDQEWNLLPAMRLGKVTENWKVAPTGGEMVPGAAKKWLGEGWETTKRAVREAHFTWIGPYCPAMVPNPTPEFKTRAEELVRTMGYEYRLTRVSVPTRVAIGEPIPFAVDGVNQGVAPFYYPWPVQVVLVAPDGHIAVRTPVKADIRRWQPGGFGFGGTMKVFAPGTYRLAVGIIDPWKRKPSVRFANALPVVDGYTVLSDIEVRRPAVAGSHASVLPGQTVRGSFHIGNTP